MKKLLSVLAAVGVVSSTVTSVVACGTKKENKSENKPEEPKDDLNEIIKDFKEEVTKIYNNHIKNEVLQNLIGLEKTEKNYLFIKKDNIKNFSNREKEITLENKKQIENDENVILKSKLLEEKLNELKKVNKYKVILDEVDSLFEGVEIIYNDNFKIKSGELTQGVYIGNFINEYKINIKYKGKNDIEKFELRDILKYTSTDSEAFKVAGDNLGKNIEKDFLVSNEMKKYSNFEWSDIKGNKQFYEGYGEFTKEIKNYINSNDDYKNNLINFIKSSYFDNFKNLNLEFNKKNIYISSVFKTNLLNVFENKSTKSFENYMDSEQNSEKIFKTIFRNDPNSQLNKESLKELYFTENNINKWKKELLDLKNKYIESIKLSKDQINLVQKTNEYISADSIGNIKLKGATIVIGSGENKYVHELSDFNLSVTYNVSSKVEEKIDFLSEFTSKILIKGLHEFYGIDSSFKYPKFNSEEDYLMNIGNKEIGLKIWEILNKKSLPNNGALWNIFSSFNFSFFNHYSQNMSKFIDSLKIKDIMDSLSTTFFIFSNWSNSLYDYERSTGLGSYNNKIDYVLNEKDISFVPARGGSKDKNPDSITFKLGYLAVNFKYEKLYKLSENQKSKVFIKFI